MEEEEERAHRPFNIYVPVASLPLYSELSGRLELRFFLPVNVGECTVCPLGRFNSGGTYCPYFGQKAFLFTSYARKRFEEGKKVNK